MKWQIKKLDEVCEIIIGGTPSRGIADYWREGTLPWVSIRDMTREGKFITETKEKITEKGVQNSNVKLIPKDTLLFSFKLSIGKLAFAGEDLYTNEAIAGFVIKDKNELDKNFLYYFLQSSTFDTAQHAVKGNTLNKEKMKVLEIPLPPLKTQKEIVKKLDEKFEKLNKAKRLRAEALADTEKILSQTLHEIFEEGKKMGWEEKSFDDEQILKMTSGGTPSRGNKDFYIGNIPWLKSGELQDNTDIKDSEEKISEEAVKKSSAKIFPKGTVLFAMYGATAGKIGILGIDASTNQAVAGMIPVSSKLDKKFLYYFLMKKREEIIAQAWGGAQPNLSQTILKTFSIPLPSLPEQKKIVKQLDALSAKIRQTTELQKSQLVDLKKLEKSYLREAFNGEL